MAPVASTQALPLRPESPPRCKYRVRFAKAGLLRLVSHHDLMHVAERMFRRADLPVPPTEGFNPRPRMWFALSLALGVAGLNEILEFELSQPLPADDVKSRLIAQAPPGLEIRSVQVIDVKVAARVRRALYRFPIAETGDLAARCASFLACTESWAERLRPHPRRINIRPFVHELHAQDDRLEMALWSTPNGAARPEEVIHALGLGHLLDCGAVIERTDLEIYDELPPGTPGPPLIESAIEEISAKDSDRPLGRMTAIVDNPMSFDS
jgi:radical SAM-linked protein